MFIVSIKFTFDTFYTLMRLICSLTSHIIKIEETCQKKGCIKLGNNLDFILIIYVFQYQMIVKSY